MALGYRLPGTIIEEVTGVTTGRATSSQRKPCFIGKASPYKKIENEEIIRSNVSNIDVLANSSKGIAAILAVGPQKGLSSFKENTHFRLTDNNIEWILNEENSVVISGSVGNDLIASLGITLDTPIAGSDATSGYQRWGFSITKTVNSATGYTDDRTAGYQQWGFTAGKTVSSLSGLANDSTTYTASISVNGVANSISIIGSASQTIQEVIDEINKDLTGATASFIATGNGYIRITSATVGASSSIAITDTDLFGTLSQSSDNPEAAVAGTNGIAHTASISVDGTPNAISVYGYESLTIGTLITAINADLSGAVASWNTASNSIQVTSSTTGSGSSIAITNTNLFSALTNANASVTTAVPGAVAIAGSQEFGLNVLSTDTTPLLANSRYFFKVNSTEYMILTGGSSPTYNQLVTLIQSEISGDGITATFATSDIKITNNSTGTGNDVEITAGSNNSASKGELTLTLSGAVLYQRLAGKCQVLFTPDNGTTNYVFGVREDISAGATKVTLTGAESQLKLIDQNSDGSANKLIFKNNFISSGAKYYVSYTYNREETDYLKYKEFTNFDDLTEDLGYEIPANDLVIIGKIALKTFGIPKIGVIQVPLDNEGNAANVSYIDALDQIRYRDVQTVCALNTNTNVLSAVKAHVIQCSLPENGRYRIAYFGAAAGTPVGSEEDSGSLKGLAVALKHERCILINATRATHYYVDVDTGEELSTIIDGSVIAAILAAYRDSYASPVTTLLNQTVPMINLFEEDYDDYYSEYYLTEAGTSSCYLVAPASGLCRVIDDLTTDNSTIEKNNINIITAKDYIAKDVAIQMDRAFKGQLIKDRSAYKDSVQGYLTDLFKQYKANSVIESMGSLSVNLPTTKRDTVEIFYSYYAVYTHKYTVGRFSLAI